MASDQPGSTYWGEFSRGEKEGLGIGEWDEGSRYVGQPGAQSITSHGWLRWLAGISSGYGLLTSDGQRNYRRGFLRRFLAAQGPIPECQEARRDALTCFWPWREVRGSIAGLMDAGHLSHVPMTSLR